MKQSKLITSRGDCWVLGLDIASTISGWAIVSSKNINPQTNYDHTKQKIEHYGTIRAHGTNLHERIWVQYQGISEIIKEFKQINSISVEDSYFSTKYTKAFKALMKTQGAAVIAAKLAGIPVKSYTAKEARRLTTDDGNSTKKTAREWLFQSFEQQLKDDTTEDESDAIIIALAHLKTICIDQIALNPTKEKYFIKK